MKKITITGKSLIGKSFEPYKLKTFETKAEAEIGFGIHRVKYNGKTRYIPIVPADSVLASPCIVKKLNEQEYALGFDNDYENWTGMNYRNYYKTSDDFSAYNTEANVIKMDGMYANCFRLESVNNIKIPYEISSVCTFRSMFRGCTSLKTIDLSGIKARRIKDLSEMFEECFNIESVILENLQTRHVTNFSFMFKNCYKLKSLDLSKLDVSYKCTSLGGMFKNCYSMESLKIGNWNTENCLGFGSMFENYGVYSKKKQLIDLSSFDFKNAESTAKMFKNANVDFIVGEKFFHTSNCKYMNEMFDGFIGNIIPRNIGSYTSPILNKTFKQTIYTAFDYSSVIDASFLFRGTHPSNSIVLVEPNKFAQGLVFHIPTFKNSSSMEGMFEDTSDVDYYDVYFYNTPQLTSLFNHTSAYSIRLRNIDTRSFSSYEQNMSRMFANCKYLKYIIIDDTEFKFKLVEDILADLHKDTKIIVPRIMINVYKTKDFWKNHTQRFIAMEDCDIELGYVKSAPN